jgi:hypothetical protein
VKNLNLMFLLAILLLTGHHGISQKKNQVELYIAPTLAGIMDGQNHSADYTSAGLRYDVGVVYMRRTDPIASFGTGFSYSSLGYNFKYTYTDVNGYNADPGQTITEKKKVFRNFIELPIMFSAQLWKIQESAFLVDIELINQLLISTRRTSNIGEDVKESFREIVDEDRTIYNIAVQLGASYQERISNNFYLEVGPYFKIGIRQDPKQWNAGLKFAMGYDF